MTCDCCRGNRATLDLVSFARLSDLEVLKLRGFVGLTLPLSGNFNELRVLSDLRSLTTLVS